MKKIVKYLLLTTLLIPIMNAKAASGLIDIYASNKEVVVGNTTTVTVYCNANGLDSEGVIGCEYTLSYDTNKLQLLTTGGDGCNMGRCVYATTSASSSRSFDFKVIATGSSTVTTSSKEIKFSPATSDEEYSLSPGVDPVSINGYIPVPDNPTPGTSSGSNPSSPSTPSTPKVYSTNNNLSSLSIEGQTITPDFNKDTLKYSTTVDASIEKINITATLEDPTAQIIGIGEQIVTEGLNKFDIVVTSEKGTTKTYTLNITVTDANPIKVTIDNNEYLVLKKLNTLKAPKDCVESKVKINDIEVPSYTCKNTNFTLVGLKDKDGNSNLYIYDKNTYSLYNEINFNSLIIGIIDTDEIIDGYEKMEVIINKNKVMGLKTSANSKYSLIYGINIETGEKNWYMYEETEGTIQKFNNEYQNLIDKKINNAKILIYVFGGITVLLSILVIALASTKSKQKDSKKDIVTFLEKEKKTDKSNSKDKKEVEEKNTDTKSLTKEIEPKKKKKNSSHDIFDGL